MPTSTLKITLSIKFASAFYLGSRKWTGGQGLPLLLFLPLLLGPKEGEKARRLTVKVGSQLWSQDKAAIKARKTDICQSMREGWCRGSWRWDCSC